MAFHDNVDNDFGKQNFPTRNDPANKETGKSELYPERLQDEINEIYQKDRVLPRIEGIDYEKDNEQTDSGGDSVSTFPFKY